MAGADCPPATPAPPVSLSAELQQRAGMCRSVVGAIGGTPMVQLQRIPATFGAAEGVEVLLKLESENPMGSVKDRLALGIITDLEARGVLVRGADHTVVEATSGNTGIGLAQICAVRGYKCALVMPDTMSKERRAVLLALGATVTLTPGAKGMKGAIAVAERIVAATPGAVLAKQFESPANAQIHYETTGPEIWEATGGGKFDCFVAGVGTGGTLAGVTRFLREKGWGGEIFAVEPAESTVLSGGTHTPHKIQGIGPGFIPPVVASTLPGVSFLQVPSAAAIEIGRRLPKEEGLFLGISSGAAVHAACQWASRATSAGKRVVAIAPSYGERYLSTALFDSYFEQAAALPTTPVE